MCIWIFDTDDDIAFCLFMLDQTVFFFFFAFASNKLDRILFAGLFEMIDSFSSSPL